MFANRIHNGKPARREGNSGPTGVPTVTLPVGFVIAPMFMGQQAAWQAQLYQAAYERARAAAEVPRHYRRFFSVWN
jgi:hypothetical protein